MFIFTPKGGNTAQEQNKPERCQILLIVQAVLDIMGASISNFDQNFLFLISLLPS